MLSAHLLVCTLNPKQAQYPSGYVILTIIKHSFTLVENGGHIKSEKRLKILDWLKKLSLKLVIYTTYTTHANKHSKYNSDIYMNNL